MGMLQEYLAAYKNTVLLISFLVVATTSLLLIALLRLAQILPTPSAASSTNPKAAKRPPPSDAHPTHLLIVLGSGGHTAEMLNILSSIPNLSQLFTQRTYVVSSGDSFSAGKAVEFEKEHISQASGSESICSVVTVRRARRVHQSFLSTPVTTLLSLWDCIAVLRGEHPDFRKGTRHIYPDLILTNGPGTGVCVVAAALLLRFFGFSGPTAAQATSATQRGASDARFTDQGQMRTVFIESWARVKTLSLSGKLLRPVVNRCLVQWPQLAEIQGEGVEYIGPLVS